MKIYKLKLLVYLSVILITGAGSRASIIGVGGSGDILTAGSGVGYTADFFGDPTLIIHGWDEVQNFTLTTNLVVDITTAGIYNTTASLTPGFIPAGTVINSHSFYYDPLVGGGTNAGFQFDGVILGVIVEESTFPDYFLTSDYLIPGSVPSANIPTTHFAARGLELGINIDHLTVGATTVQMTLFAGSPGDQVRVITAAVVPEPATASLVIASGVAVFFSRRRPILRR